jgi:hypothetical protein
MSTIYTFHQECAAASDLAAADEFLVYDDSAGVTKNVTYGLMRSYMGSSVSVTAASLTVTLASHANRVIVIDATPCAVTLPQATGTGATYTFVIKTAATATATTIAVANATDVMRGVAWAATTTSDNAEAFIASATSDTISLNGTTKGGVVGDIFVIRDVYTGVFNVQGYTSPTGTEATPFSAAV